MIKPNKITKRPKLKSRSLFLWIVIPFAVLALLIAGWMLHNTNEKNKISAVADTVKPDPSWRLVHSQVIGSLVFCGDEPCPYVRKDWETKEPVTEQSFSDFISRSGGSDKDIICTEAREGKVNCYAIYTYKGYRIHTSSSYTFEKYSIYLGVEQSEKDSK